MGQDFKCHYHEHQPSTWQCSDCERLYCDSCIPRPPETLPMGKCTLCGGALSFQGPANNAEPFWHKIHSFFSYPVNAQALLFLGVMSLLGAVIGQMGLLAIPISILYVAIYSKYLFRVIEQCSYGQFTPPPIAEAFTGGGFSLFFKQAAIFFIAALCVVYAGKSGSSFLIFTSIALVALALPASVMIMAQEQSFLEAINPAKLFFVIHAIGWPYLILNAFLFILSTSPSWVIYQLQDVLHGTLLNLIAMAANGFFSLVMAAMMGYCLYQFQGPLGYTTADEAEACPDAESYYKQLALAENHIFVKEGQYDEAIKDLRLVINKYHRNDLELNQRLHRLLINSDDLGLLKKHAHHYIELLIKSGRLHEAAQIFLTVQGKADDYRLQDPHLKLEIAKGLQRNRQFREAILLLKNFHKEYPQHPDTAEAYLLSAKAYSEGLGKDKQALQLLNFIIKQYPSAPVIPEARIYLETINKVVTGAALRR